MHLLTDLLPYSYPLHSLSKAMSSISLNCIMSCLIISFQYFFGFISTFLETVHSQPLTSPHCICTSPHYIPEPPAFCPAPMPLLVSDIVVFNSISPSICTHASLHLHLRHYHLLNVILLDWPTLCSTQLSWSNHSYITCLLCCWCHFLITKDFGCEPLFHPPCTNTGVTFSSISPFPWIIDPWYLKISVLDGERRGACLFE